MVGKWRAVEQHRQRRAVASRGLSCGDGVVGMQPGVFDHVKTAGTTGSASVWLGCCNTHQVHDFAYVAASARSLPLSAPAVVLVWDARQQPRRHLGG